MALCLIAFARLAFAETTRSWWRRGEADLVAQVRQAQGAVSFDEIFAAGFRLSQREAVAAFRGLRRTGTRVP